ncbi:MAG TPA: hypothetical protein VIV60_33425 [Polyangiaceae bacterium]
MTTALASTSLVPDAIRLRSYAEDPAWQRTWLNLESENWRSLAIVPTGELSSLDLVHGLASVAWQQRGTPLIIADLRKIALPSLAAARGELRRRATSGERLLVAVHSLEKNPTTASLVREVDKAVLCVYLGHTSRSDVKNAIRELGAQRCLGTILVRGLSVAEDVRMTIAK